MKRYKLKKDLPTFEAGCLFGINSDGDLCFVETASGDKVKTINNAVYSAEQLRRYPNILTEWFEEIPEEPKRVWDLKDGDECWMLDVDLEPLQIEWRGTPYDIRLRELGQIYLTKSELLAEIAHEEAKQILLRDTKGFKPDWNNWSEFKHYVLYDQTVKKFRTYAHSFEISGHIYFKNRIDAEASIKTHEKEWKTYLGVEE